MRQKKPKKVAYRLIPARSFDLLEASLYAQLHELIAAHHEDLRDARIALAWCTSWKADVDGQMTIGKCKRASDLDREMVDFDFIILLNEGFCLMASDAQRRALLDHELCHAALKYDKSGEPVEDERGRKVYRTRKHDVEEFACIVERHGLYKHDLERFAQSFVISAPQRARELQEKCTVCAGSGMKDVVVDGVEQAARCECWLKGQELIRIAQGRPTPRVENEPAPAPLLDQVEAQP